MKKKILVLMCMVVLGITACGSSGNQVILKNDQKEPVADNGNSESNSEDSEDEKKTIALSKEDAIYDGKLEGIEMSNDDWNKQYAPALTFEYQSTEIMDTFEGDYRILTAPKGYMLYVVKLEAFNGASNTISFSDNEWYLRVDDVLYPMQNGLTSFDTQIGSNKVNPFVFLVPEGVTKGTVIRQRSESDVDEGEPKYITFETKVE
ncbi:MAG: hypothetical protein HFI37_04200 [Lachnospiraceae bacterium]|nr:hypothetical protein [Lachnospiraceae bacterium]